VLWPFIPGPASIGELVSRMANLAGTLNRLSHEAPDRFGRSPRSQVSLRLVSRPRSDMRLDKLKYFVQMQVCE
jgi:hypothetical protein